MLHPFHFPFAHCWRNSTGCQNFLHAPNHACSSSNRGSCMSFVAKFSLFHSLSINRKINITAVSVIRFDPDSLWRLSIRPWHRIPGEELEIGTNHSTSSLFIFCCTSVLKWKTFSEYREKAIHSRIRWSKVPEAITASSSSSSTSSDRRGSPFIRKWRSTTVSKRSPECIQVLVVLALWCGHCP